MNVEGEGSGWSGHWSYSKSWMKYSGIKKQVGGVRMALGGKGQGAAQLNAGRLS